MKITAYTDGSVQQVKKQGGWAAVLLNGKTDHIAGKLVTDDNYEAELMAIYKSLELTEGDISIVTDHQAIARELNRMIGDREWQLPEKCKPLWMRVAYEAQNRIVDVQWQKGHSCEEMRQAHNLANKEASGYVR